MLVTWVTAALFAYLLGSIPWAYVVARLVRGIDIRQHGSGNVGTANVVRVVGWPAGAVVLALDVAKGTLATILGGALGLGPDGQAACGFLAAVGHSWTPFLRFQGGKAVATSLGAFLAMEPTGALFAVAVAIAVFLATGYFSAASLSGTLVGMAWMVVAAVLGRVPVVYAAFGLALAGLIFFRHISNLRRILAGTERRVRWPWSQSA